MHRAFQWDPLLGPNDAERRLFLGQIAVVFPDQCLPWHSDTGIAVNFIEKKKTTAASHYNASKLIRFNEYLEGFILVKNACFMERC